jgi:hypothetical protein
VFGPRFEKVSPYLYRCTNLLSFLDFMLCSLVDIYLVAGGMSDFHLQGKMAERRKSDTDIGNGMTWKGWPDRPKMGQQIGEHFLPKR